MAHRRQLLVVLGVDHVPEAALHLGNDGGEEGFPFRVGLGLGGDPKLHFAGLAVGGQGGVGLAVDQILQFVFHVALALAEDAEHVGVEPVAAALLEIGHHVVREHGPKLPGRAGHEDGRLPVLLHEAAGGGAPGVGEDGAACGGEHGLLFVVGGGLPAEALEPLHDPVPFLGVQDQLEAQGRRHGLLGEVVLRGPEAAGEQHHVGSIEGRQHRLREPLRIVAHHLLAVQVHPQGGQLLGHELGVGVHDLPHEELGAHTDDFRDHSITPVGSGFCSCTRSPSRTTGT